MSELVLTGLDGSNPLGFMAALGVLEAVTDRGAAGRLSWHEEGVWRPVLSGCDVDLDALVGWLDEDRRRCESDPALALEYGGKRDLKPAPEEFRGYLEEMAGSVSPGQRRSADWAAAFGSDVVVDNNGNTKPTALHFTAGQQQFLKMVGELVAGVTEDDLREALVGPWSYGRPLPVMGWDATMARDYALRASDPSTDKKQGVPGADWLGVRGLASLPVAPIGKRLMTTGCVGGWKMGSFRWPLWRVPLDREMTRTLVRLRVDAMSAEERIARGVGIVYESGIKRSDQGGYGSMTPAAVI